MSAPLSPQNQQPPAAIQNPLPQLDSRGVSPLASRVSSGARACPTRSKVATVAKKTKVAGEFFESPSPNQPRLPSRGVTPELSRRRSSLRSGSTRSSLPSTPMRLGPAAEQADAGTPLSLAPSEAFTLFGGSTPGKYLAGLTQVYRRSSSPFDASCPESERKMRVAEAGPVLGFSTPSTLSFNDKDALDTGSGATLSFVHADAGSGIAAGGAPSRRQSSVLTLDDERTLTPTAPLASIQKALASRSPVEARLSSSSEKKPERATPNRLSQMSNISDLGSRGILGILTQGAFEDDLIRERGVSASTEPNSDRAAQRLAQQSDLDDLRGSFSDLGPGALLDLFGDDLVQDEAAPRENLSQQEGGSLPNSPN